MIADGVSGRTTRAPAVASSDGAAAGTTGQTAQPDADTIVVNQKATQAALDRAFAGITVAVDEVGNPELTAAHASLRELFAPTAAEAAAMATPIPGASPVHLNYDASTGFPGTYDVTPANTPDHLSPDGLTIGNITYSGGNATWTVNQERTAAMNAALAQFDHDAIQGSTLGLRYGAELASGEALIGLAAKGISLWRTSRVVEGGSGVWKLNPFERGQQIEQALGHNLPSNFPTIDRFENGIATSIKSLDVDAATYLNNTTLNRTLTRYVDKAAAFNGRTWAGRTIESDDILGRGLDLAIPHGGNGSQQILIDQAVRYGVTRGVVVKPIIFP